ncbi:MAG: YdcF family protein [Firmicutes bacterium]|nr:YdcF family protein [Bacillota bacterium]
MMKVEYTMNFKLVLIKTSLISLLGIVVLLICLLGFTYGTVFLLGTWLSLFLVYFLYFYVAKFYISLSKGFILLRKIAISGLILFYISFIGIEAFVIREWHSNTNSHVDYAVILGAGLDGDKISNTVKTRLDTGYDYLVKNETVKVIVSGGQGEGELVSEAEAMGKYLIQKGIDSQRIIYEDKSISTRQNIVFSKNIAYSNSTGEPILLIITSDYHMLRAKLLCHQLNLNYYGLASTSPLMVRINYSIREYCATIKDLVTTSTGGK